MPGIVDQTCIQFVLQKASEILIAALSLPTVRFQGKYLVVIHLFLIAVQLFLERKKDGTPSKLLLAEKKASKVINPTRQTHETATVEYIKSYCKQEFHDHSLVLVSGNGLQIEDSDATRGY